MSPRVVMSRPEATLYRQRTNLSVIPAVANAMFAADALARFLSQLAKVGSKLIPDAPKFG